MRMKNYSSKDLFKAIKTAFSQVKINMAEELIKSMDETLRLQTDKQVHFTCKIINNLFRYMGHCVKCIFFMDDIVQFYL